jgi:hypothetical protein
MRKAAIKREGNVRKIILIEVGKIAFGWLRGSIL